MPGIPCGIGPYMINDQYEIGHFEPCTSVTGSAVFTEGSFTDTYYLNCQGPYDKATEDPNLEPDDSPCFKFGDTHGGTAAPNLVTGCDVFFDAVGDRTGRHAVLPGLARLGGTGPVPVNVPAVATDHRRRPSLSPDPVHDGHQRERAQHELRPQLGYRVRAPATGPRAFLPVLHPARVGGLCVWEYGNMRNGNTFGGDAQYGAVGPSTLGAFAGPTRSNPNC